MRKSIDGVRHWGARSWLGPVDRLITFAKSDLTKHDLRGRWRHSIGLTCKTCLEIRLAAMVADGLWPTAAMLVWGSSQRTIWRRWRADYAPRPRAWDSAHLF